MLQSRIRSEEERVRVRYKDMFNKGNRARTKVLICCGNYEYL